jgi:hypothetical protein
MNRIIGWERAVIAGDKSFFNARKRKRGGTLLCLLLAFVLVCLIPCLAKANEDAARVDNPPASRAAPTATAQQLTLEQCVELALKNNRLRKISKASLDIAEAQASTGACSTWGSPSIIIIPR